MTRLRSFLVFSLILLLISPCASSDENIPLTAPKLTNNPSWDIIATNNRPLFSFFNASGGTGKRIYTVQIDTSPKFDSEALITYESVPEQTQYITGKKDISHKLLEEKDTLSDKTRYHWRVRAVDEAGNEGPWATSRFYLDTQADDSFMGLVRVPVAGVKVSSGENPKNITDLDDPGQVTFWRGTPPGSETQWVEFDLGRIWDISRIWMLSNPNSPDGWLKNFGWQTSADGKAWIGVKGAAVENNDTFRNILNFPRVKTRYLRLLIKDWYGYSPQINAVTLYAEGKPPVPDVPEGDYVLLVGNQQNGYTFSALADFVESLPLGLKTITVPHYEVSLEMLNSLKNRPVAVIMSGNNADYPNLPMFEYNGEYEIIRESDIPILGICCGHQQLAMAYGYTYARSMGWDDITAMEKARTRTEIEIVKQDPVFKGMKSPFTAVEIHGWAVAITPGDHEVIARSSYVQAIKSTKKMLYGEQFHGEIKAPYNEGRTYLVNFLEMALENKTEVTNG